MIAFSFLTVLFVFFLAQIIKFFINDQQKKIKNFSFFWFFAIYICDDLSILILSNRMSKLMKNGKKTYLKENEAFRRFSENTQNELYDIYYSTSYIYSMLSEEKYRILNIMYNGIVNLDKNKNKNKRNVYKNSFFRAINESKKIVSAKISMKSRTDYRILSAWKGAFLLFKNFFIFSVAFLLHICYTIFEVKINEFKRGR